MFEVELKVRADHETLRARLEGLGAEWLGRTSQADTYYDAPHRNFAETDEALRLREESAEGAGGESPTGGAGGESPTGEAGGEPSTGGAESTTKVTYKGPLVERESKTREEHETVVGDGETMAGVLDGLGFEPAATVEKRRERYRLDGYVVTLDDVEGLGEFLEVEREATEAEIDDVREGARELLRRLGLDPDEQIRISYLGLLLDDARE